MTFNPQEILQLTGMIWDAVLPVSSPETGDSLKFERFERVIAHRYVEPRPAPGRVCH